jgi:hypothetical protein
MRGFYHSPVWWPVEGNLSFSAWLAGAHVDRVVAELDVRASVGADTPDRAGHNGITSDY